MELSASRSVSRSKTVDVTPSGEGRYRFVARLTDSATGGNFPGDSMTIHDFGIEGEVEGPELTIISLNAHAFTHPFAECPFVIPTTTSLVGKSLMSGWRQVVLEKLGGTHGCTHVNTLLLGLAELSPLIFFLQINEKVSATQEARDDGTWTVQALQVAPRLGGVCHGLRTDGAALTAARKLSESATEVPSEQLAMGEQGATRGR